MFIVKKLFDLVKILFVTFIFSLVIDFFFGAKILSYFDSFFAKSQFMTDKNISQENVTWLDGNVLLASSIILVQLTSHSDMVTSSIKPPLG